MDTNTGAKASANPHRVPSKHEVDTLGDELASLENKLSKARRKAILSAGEARRDQLELEEIEKLTAAKAAEFRSMVDRYTLPPVKADIPAALEAVREKLGAVAPAGKAVTDDCEIPDTLKPAAGGGVVKPGSYLVGERGAEMIVPASVAQALEKVAEADTIKGDKVETIELTGTTTADQAKALRAKFLVPAEDVTIVDEAFVHVGQMPPSDPVNGTRWRYPRPGQAALEMFFDDVSGWSRVDENDPAKFHQVKAGDLTSDFWQKGELDAAMRKGVKAPGLFSFGRR